MKSAFNILAAKCRMMGSAVRCKQRNMLSDRQRPRIWRMSELTLASSSAMALAARREHAETSDERKSRLGPRNFTAPLSVVVVRAGVTPVARPPVDEYTCVSGAVNGAP